MIRPAFVCGLMAAATVVTASAEDFPLNFQTIPAKDVMSFIGGAGVYGLLQQAKPAKLKKEPRAVSRQALYGECRDTSTGAALVFRLDETRGEGQGYDQLIVDMNQNGDLTDDPVVRPTTLARERAVVSPTQLWFGPIQAPADKMIAGGRPIYYAQAYIFNRPILRSGVGGADSYIGQLMLKAGWYLETTVELDGLKQKVGVFDGNANLRLGDASQPQTMTTARQRTWYFRPGDYLLLDTDGSGGFENDVFQSEACPFGPILYLGAKAYKVSLTEGCQSLRVERWSEPLAEVALQPKGNEVRTLTLAWEGPDGRWQLIRPAVTDGKVMVPPGNYRLYACTLLGQGAAGDQVMVSGTQRTPQTPISIAADKANSLNCGGPLEIKVTATGPRTATSRLLAEEFAVAKVPAGSTMRISATVAGAGGEIYSTFLKGDGFKARPPKPTFSIVETGGKTVARGNLEYG